MGSLDPVLLPAPALASLGRHAAAGGVEEVGADGGGGGGGAQDLSGKGGDTQLTPRDNWRIVDGDTASAREGDARVHDGEHEGGARALVAPVAEHLAKQFGFQRTHAAVGAAEGEVPSSVANQVDHLVALLANLMDRPPADLRVEADAGFGPRVDAAARILHDGGTHAGSHGGLLGNYGRWLRHTRLPSSLSLGSVGGERGSLGSVRIEGRRSTGTTTRCRRESIGCCSGS